MSSNLHKRLMQSGLGGLPPKIPTTSGSRPARGRQRDYTALKWSEYFSGQEYRNLSDNRVFNVYSSSCSDSSGPVLFLLHGGGYSGLTWALFAKEIIAKVDCRVVAPDLRGHGDTCTSDDTDLSANTMASDIASLWTDLFSEDRPQIILVGHSMGGALAVHAALLDKIENVVGLCVIDVVEGTAMDALAGMQNFLRSRPSKFKSLPYAIEWSMRSGQVRNIESARVSMPGQLKSITSGKCAIHEIDSTASPDENSGSKHRFQPANSIAEEQEEEDGTTVNNPAPPSVQDPKPSGEFTWRIDLTETESHWTSWFEGLSGKFLSVPAAKLLLLAGVDRLDRDLTVGQMQGKFQLQVLPQAGHAVHEDVPDKVADVLATFLVRNKFAQPKDQFHRTFPAC